MAPGPQQRPLFTPELIRAIRAESGAAICHHWGVLRKTVTRWRRRLGVPRFTLGTQLLWIQLAPKLHRRRRPPPLELFDSGATSPNTSWEGSTEIQAMFAILPSSH